MTGDLVSLVRAGADLPGAAPIAVRDASGQLRFDELLGGADAVAAVLTDHGIGRGDRVGVWMEKQTSTIQVVLGILIAGAAYVPLDPAAPPLRCQAIARDCGFAGFAVDGPRAGRTEAVLAGGPTRLVLTDSIADVAGPGRGVVAIGDALVSDAAPPPRRLPRPDDPAYILYTSGSTGVPKGVVHTHRSGTSFATWVRDRFGTGPSDVFSSHAPLHFDLSIADLYTSLGSGASVRLLDRSEAMLAPYLARNIETWGITVWYSVPGILVAMLETGLVEEGCLDGIRLLFFAGEVFPLPQLRRLRAAVPEARLVNLFGPTETNVCTYYEVPAGALPRDMTSLPIGRSCENLETYVGDADGRPVADGSEGFLWVRGPNLMAGYWNDPVRTGASLRPDPRGGTEAVYNTGDVVRLDDIGTYEFLGRRDHMVKVRGYRVDLGDVEAGLIAHDAVLEAAVVPLLTEGAATLAGVVVLRSGRALDLRELRTHCEAHLPAYMIPERLEIRRALPRTSTGKVDRTALGLELGGAG